MRKHVWKKFLPITLAVAIFATSIPVDVYANTVSQNTVGQEETANAGVPMMLALEAQAEGTVGDLLDGTTISIDSAVLKATYKNEGDATTTVVNMTDGGEYEIPYNADINMRLDYVIADGNAIGDGEYVYKLPDSIRVDVEATHELEDGTGKSIGKVHIAQDGTLTFQFYTDVLKDNTNVSFYVQFDGGLSESLQESGQEADITFPTAGGDFNISITTTDATEDEVDPEPKDVSISKYGTQIVDENGQKMIEWTVELGPEGRDTLDGTIIDQLAPGLAYVDGSATLVDAYEGNITTTVEGQNLKIELNDVKAWYHAKVTFRTTYDASVFANNIDNTTSQLINNEAIFNPDDGTPGVTDDSTVQIKPTMVEKADAVVADDNTITWTVILNRERLNIEGATYTDTIGAGMEYISGSIEGLPDGTVFTETADGFTVAFPDETEYTNTYTITYKTKVTDMTVQSYKNTATLTDGTDVTYNVSDEGIAPGLNLLDKSFSNFNSVTNTFTWNIVVNTSEKELENVVVNDTLPSGMEFVSATVTPAKTTTNADGSTDISFEFAELSEQLTITIITKIADPTQYNETDYYTFYNEVTLNSDEITTPIEDKAETWTQIKSPVLGSKSGEMKDGVIEWTVTVNQPQLTVEGIAISDVLPENTEYVEGTFHIQNMYYDTAPLYRDPIVGTDASGKQTISYTLDAANAEETAFYQKGFWIVYRTRVTDVDMATTDNTYVNDATLSVTYEGDIVVDDDISSTVNGVVGGVIDKSYSYRSGDPYVDWTVDINEGRNDMSSVLNAKIVDELADYFDYVSGTLYLVDVNGNETEVAEGDYLVSVVNGRLIVQLPKDENGYYLGDNCYRFKFRTRFNVLAAELEGKQITNTVSFEGSGEVYTSQTDSIKNVSFSSSSAGAVIEREIRVKKVDSVSKKALAGAKFELYLGTECIGEAISGSDGYAVFEDLNSITGYTVELKEIQAPDGYELPTDAVTTIEFTADNLMTDKGIEYYAIEIANTAKETTSTGDIQIKKTDADGDLLSGAEFGLYSDAACTQLLETRVATDGTATFSSMVTGTYYVKEISSPAGYKPSDDVITVTIDASGAVTYTGGATEAVFINEKATGILKITKRDDKDATTLLAGAEFSLYKDALCTDRVDTKTTDGSGVLEFTGLELGTTYYYRETTAPAGYVLDTTIYSVVIGDGTEKADVTEAVVVTNTEALGNILIYKVDNSAIPVPLQGVTFRLYESNGTTVVKDAEGNDYEVTTDASGVAAFNNLPFGVYIVSEVSGKDGYAISTAATNVTVKALGNTEVTIVNDKIVVDIQILKEGSLPAGGVGKLAGAEFGLYTEKGVQVAKGTTDADGKLVFRDVAYGNYYVEELKAPAGYNINSSRKKIDITATELENAYKAGIVHAISVTNELQNGSIKITKVDENGAALDGATFTLYDENMLPVNRTGVTNPVDSDASGLTTFTGLSYGTYYVQETEAPDGYVRDTQIYKVIVNSDVEVTEYTKDDNTTAALEIVNIKSDAPYISFKLKKTDSETSAPLANATFELYKDGVPCTPAVTAVTDANGIAYFRRIHVQNDDTTTVYSVREVAAPTGYKLEENLIVLGDREDVNIYGDPLTEGGNNLTDEEIKFVTAASNLTGEVTNEPLKGTVKITKTGLSATTLLQGAEFTLYDESKTAVTGITDLANPAVTDATGVATFTNLPVGIYYIKETKAPKGYTLNTTETKVVVTDETVHEISYKDTAINVSVSKKSLTGETELAGAALKIYKKDDATKSAVDSWTTGTGSHRVMVGALEVDTTYVLTEIVAPNGYGYMTDQEFTVNADGSITLGAGSATKDGQTIVVRDTPIQASISKVDADTNAALANAIIGIYDENGAEVDRFTTNTTAYDIPLGILTAPDGSNSYREYTIRELSAPAGYELADDIKIAVDATGTIYEVAETNGVKAYNSLGNNPIIVMKDMLKPTGTIYIRKLNDTTSLDIAGATLEIRDSADTQTIATIAPAGKPIAIECGTAGSGKTLIFDIEYILRETVAPDGYLMADDIHFSVNSSGEITIITGSSANVNGDKDTLMMRDKELELKVRKQDAYGQVLNGAVLSLSEYNMTTSEVGTEIIEFTSGGGTAQDILSKDLQVNTSYILREISAPDGYKKAADIIFTIQADGSLVREDGVPVYNNTIVMEDDDAGVCIGKISLNTGNGLAGSTLELSSVDDTHFTTTTWVSDGTNRTWDLLEFTPGCTYTLTELNAPLGYAYTDPIVFTIDANDHQIYINGQKADNRTVHIADGKLELAVDKLDFYSKENVKGAELGIYDENGTLMTSWTSGVGKIWVDTSTFVAGRDTYKEYTLREIKAPAGYKKAADIPFAIDRDGKIYLVKEDATGTKTYDLVADKVLTMYDVPYIRVEKLDGDGNAVVGAKLEVSAKDDASFTPITWVTDGEAYWFDDNTFKPGVTYVLKELEAPAGYTLAEEISFTVDGEGKLYVAGQLVENKRIVMLDYRINTDTNAPGVAPGTNNPGINTGIPKTGDGTPLGTLMLFMAVGFFGTLMSFGGYFIRRRKREEQL